MNKKEETIKQYGRLLYEIAAEEKKQEELKNQIGRFAGLLHKKRLLNKIDKIILYFEKYYSEKQGEVVVKATCMRDIKKSESENIKDFIEKALKKKVKLDLSADNKILGGMILQIGDKVFDGSLRTRLDELKKQMVN